MATKLVMQHVMSSGIRRSDKLPNWSYSDSSVKAKPNDNHISKSLKTSNTDYTDNWFDRIAINHLSHTLQATIGYRSKKSGYEGLVEATAMVRQKFSPSEQRELVTRALDSAFPKSILSLVRALLPPSKFQREFFAFFTTILFPWLVGPSEVRKSEINGRIEKNVVHVKKCRFLEESNCVGMCTNLCKLPSQAFIKDSFGLPFNMVPNFDDMSCEMIFGQEPPKTRDDPAFQQPCYKLCNMKQIHSTSSIS